MRDGRYRFNVLIHEGSQDFIQDFIRQLEGEQIFRIKFFVCKAEQKGEDRSLITSRIPGFYENVPLISSLNNGRAKNLTPAEEF